MIACLILIFWHFFAACKRYMWDFFQCTALVGFKGSFRSMWRHIRHLLRARAILQKEEWEIKCIGLISSTFIISCLWFKRMTGSNHFKYLGGNQHLSLQSKPASLLALMYSGKAYPFAAALILISSLQKTLAKCLLQFIALIHNCPL